MAMPVLHDRPIHGNNCQLHKTEKQRANNESINLCVSERMIMSS